jgi:hypothetical protein
VSVERCAPDAHVGTHGDRPATVYRLYDDCSQLLYVGTTCNVLTRLLDLCNQRYWFGRVARIAMTPFPTRREALVVERRAIETEGPVFNVECNPASNGDDGSGNWHWRRGLPRPARTMPWLSRPEMRLHLASLRIEGCEAAPSFPRIRRRSAA